ncbi:MAG: N-acetyl-glucosamine-6-phosphate deacetylase [Claussenomyces sp. TS43310]|nr:MAG: N-acetyl-glucosamine-6-phosphate deacetylase [Claussenomyces sp. TS43310]
MKLLVLSLLASQVAAIWPAPQSYSLGSSAVWIEPFMTVTYNGRSVRWSPQSEYHRLLRMFSGQFTKEPPGLQISVLAGVEPQAAKNFTSKAIVSAAVQRAYATIFSEKFVPWKLHPRNELGEFEPAASDAKTIIKRLDITQTGIDTYSTFKPRAREVDESYNLTVTTDGSASITAVSSTGVLHGLQTFTQLFYEHSSKSGIYSPFAPVHITDSPTYSHRGLNMDVARNWFPKSDILRTIDAISWNKMNRLHIHVTDGQSWPLDIPALPDLSRKGAYQTGLSYTPQDLEEIQIYAIYRGVEAFLEFDMPGHTTSIARAYPELIAAADAHPWATYCNEPPCGTMKLNSTAVPKFLDTLLADVIPRVSPYSSYLHTGGDEVNIQAYLLDETVKSNDTKVLTPLMQKFVDRNHDQVRAAGLTPIAWEEMALTWGLKLGKDVVVQSWQSDEALYNLTAMGHKAIFGNSNYWYLDCGKGQWLDFSNGASFDEYYPFPDYCSPTKNWRLVYSYDPTAGLSEEQIALIQGGEVHIWSEQTDPVNLDDMVWPRAGAAAEVLWSGRQDSTGQNRSQLDASPRLAEMRERMVARGITAGPVQMVFCTQANSTECSL